MILSSCFFTYLQFWLAGLHRLRCSPLHPSPQKSILGFLKRRKIYWKVLYNTTGGSPREPPVAVFAISTNHKALWLASTQFWLGDSPPVLLTFIFWDEEFFYLIWKNFFLFPHTYIIAYSTFFVKTFFDFQSSFYPDILIIAYSINFVKGFFFSFCFQ